MELHEHCHEASPKGWFHYLQTSSIVAARYLSAQKREMKDTHFSDYRDTTIVDSQHSFSQGGVDIIKFVTNYITISRLLVEYAVYDLTMSFS